NVIMIIDAMSRWVKLFFLITLSFVLVTACHQSDSQQSRVLSESANNLEACRNVQHSLGEACIPFHPQKVVILDEFYLLDSLSALGIKPVGYTPCLVCTSSDVLSEYVSDVPALGDMEAPSLEKIISLKPDLILGLEWQEQSYSLLSEIAPTIMIEDPETSGFRKTFEYLAEILNKHDQSGEILATYDEKIEEFKRQFSQKLKDEEISVVGVDGSSFYANKIGTTILSQIMVDAEIPFSSAQKSVENNGYQYFSIETLPDWDADFLFVLQNYERHAEDLESMMEHPIWSTLSAVQNGRVHPVVLDVWGPLTSIQFVDDLSQYFTEAL
ncbi:MAG: ABC transporter substrate-binding protein, partial [Cyanobacteria bacterium J06555_13]